VSTGGVYLDADWDGAVLDRDVAVEQEILQHVVLYSG
jgi:hypothetical protein